MARTVLPAAVVLLLVTLIARHALARHTELAARVAALEHLMVGVGYRPSK